jgi:hypothetical protein
MKKKHRNVVEREKPKIPEEVDFETESVGGVILLSRESTDTRSGVSYNAPYLELEIRQAQTLSQHMQEAGKPLTIDNIKEKFSWVKKWLGDDQIANWILRGTPGSHDPSKCANDAISRVTRHPEQTIARYRRSK